MKNNRILILGLAILGLSVFPGCATTGTVSADKAATQELAAYTLTKNAMLIVLQQEPAAEGPLTLLAGGIDSVFTSGQLTPEQLKRALDALKVRPKSQILIASALTDAYNLYVAATGKTLVVTTDPTAAAILRGVRRGITDGITFAHAFNAAAL